MRGEGRESARGARGSVYALFAVVVLASAMGNLSQTAVNAMIGDIMGDLGFDVVLGQWLTTSYMLMLGVTVPAVTFLLRRLSVRRHVFLAMGFFLAGAAADFLAPNFGVLLVGRVLQAVSTGMLMPLMQTVAMTRFPHGRRATAMGVASIAMGSAPNIGPTIGGAMDFAFGWRSFFVLLAAVMAALAAAAALAIKPTPALDASARLDVRSLALSTLGFGGLLLAFSEASSFAVASPFVWVPFALGALFLALFVRRQKRVAEPLVSMEIFASRQYRTGFVAQNLLAASFMGITLVVPLYVEGLCGGSALDAGVVLLPGTASALLLAPLAGVLTDRVGVRPVVLVSGLLLATGAVLMSFLNADTPLLVTTLCQAVRAAGVSGLTGPLTSWSLAQLPGRLVADGSSFCIAVRQACASLGTSAMVLAISAVGASAAGAANPAFAYQAAFGFSAVMALVMLAFVVAKVR